LRHALDRERRRLRLTRVGHQCRGLGLRGRVGKVVVRRLPPGNEVGGIGKADRRILGRLARHCDGAFGHLADGPFGNVRGGNAGLPLPDKDAQPDLDPLCPLGLFKLSGADIDADRGTGHGKRIGGIGARLAGGVKQRLGQRGKAIIGHGLFRLGIPQDR